jgi:hypothetical protein
MAKFVCLRRHTQESHRGAWLGALNYILLDHPELQETKYRVELISEIYEKQVRDGVETTDLATLNTERGLMGLCMDMFLDHTVQKQALGKITPAEKK